MAVTSFGAHYPAFHSIDALLGVQESAMFGQEFMRKLHGNPRIRTDDCSMNGGGVGQMKPLQRDNSAGRIGGEVKPNKEQGNGISSLSDVLLK